MKALTVLFLTALPAGAQAGYMGGMRGMGGGMGGAPGCTHGAVALYALLAALGYWVLQHAGKQEKNHIKWTGSILGMALAVIGLLGVLCGVGSHVKSAMHRSCNCQEQGMQMRGNCPMEGMPEEQAASPKQMQVNVKVTEAKKTN
ncbi:MAG TPA: hypothetical protein PKI19_03920 [Elusimicrobiales bacterium]|nr:hypothetical protein [Elusimicrobiales bacterium]